MNNTALESLRDSRSRGEFAFTAKSNYAAYLVNKNFIKEGESFIWADADVMFFSSAQHIFDTAMRQYSIAITPHNFSHSGATRALKVGRYNAGLIFFKVNDDSRTCIRGWAARCIEWCFNRYEDGKFADQMYLDTWQKEYKNVYDLPDKGVNLGTWNIDRYTITKNPVGQYLVDGEPLVCYHFHGFKAYETNSGIIKSLPVSVYHNGIYREYMEALQKVYAQIGTLHSSFSSGLIEKPSLFKILKQKVQKNLRAFSSN